MLGTAPLSSAGCMTLQRRALNLVIGQKCWWFCVKPKEALRFSIQRYITLKRKQKEWCVKLPGTISIKMFGFISVLRAGKGHCLEITRHNLNVGPNPCPTGSSMGKPRWTFGGSAKVRWGNGNIQSPANSFATQRLFMFIILFVCFYVFHKSNKYVWTARNLPLLEIKRRWARPLFPRFNDTAYYDCTLGFGRINILLWRFLSCWKACWVGGCQSLCLLCAHIESISGPFHTACTSTQTPISSLPATMGGVTCALLGCFVLPKISKDLWEFRCSFLLSERKRCWSVPFEQTSIHAVSILFVSIASLNELLEIADMDRNTTITIWKSPKWLVYNSHVMNPEVEDIRDLQWT